MIRIDGEKCRDLGQSRGLEWLETNGLGGFSSGTVAGLHTRRYHGILTAAIKPPVGRMVLLSKLEETLHVGEASYELSVNQYPGAVHPQGYRFLKEFRLDPFPTWTYEMDGVEIEKRLFMVDGENTTVVEYELRAGSPGDCWIELRPLVAFRDYHSLTHQNSGLDPAVHYSDGQIRIAPYADVTPLQFAHNADSLEQTGDWYLHFEYDVERERGLDAQEDLFQPFRLRFNLSETGKATLIASTEQHHAGEAGRLREGEIERRRRVMAGSPSTDPLIQQLTAAADQFIVRRGDLHSIIAGYHWFADWGRDTMIALPGIALMTGRREVARDILQAFVESVDQGMLPNRFPDSGETPEYNTVDATLWLFEAVRAYLQYTGDRDFVETRVYPKLKEIIAWHRRGTRYGIHLDGGGLLACGEPGIQLTWMDAKVGDWVVTPRYGKPVEIQALWYNAVKILAELARQFGEPDQADAAEGLAAQARNSFYAKFWNPDAGCLYDVVDDHAEGGFRDGSIRPNQILAVSLHHSMLARDVQLRVVEVVERELLTPLGLRSLAPGDPSYRPRYEGGVWERDGAYHQGTVWPWLMGPFITAYVKAHEGSPVARERAQELIQGFAGHLGDAALGQISEIADAEAPHHPRGCVAQAWSVAELLRAAVEDAYQLPVALGRGERSAASIA